MDAQVITGRVVTMAEAGTFEDGAVAIEGGKLAFVGRRMDLPERFSPLPLQSFPLITPGFCDAHTHSAWVGSRHGEYMQKLRGEGYEAIAARGGGIVASMRAIEEADVETITETLVARLRRMAALGVTTVEVKTGYGLRRDLEEKQLDAIQAASGAEGVPRVIPTLLALHALPPEARGDEGKRAAYVQGVIELVRASRDRARFVDAYVDRSAFRVEEARAVMQVAREVGLGVRMHIGQFADVGGAELAGELGARSADHLENVGPAGLEALVRGDVAVVLLPIASFVLGQAPPDVAALRRAGLRLIVASDANPGTAPSESLPLAMAFAARLYGLSTEEILAGVTREAARSLDLESLERGLVEGAPADLVGWDVPHEEALLQPWGSSRASLVIRDGRPLAFPETGRTKEDVQKKERTQRSVRS